MSAVTTFLYVVRVDTDTKEHADQVMTERIGHDEEIEDDAGVRFDYTIDYSSS